MTLAGSRRRDGPVVIDLQATQSPTTRGRGIGRYARSLAIALEAYEPGLVSSYLLNPNLPPPGDLGALVESGKVVYAGTSGAIPAQARIFHVLSPLDLALRLPEIWPADTDGDRLRRSATVYDFIPALDPVHELADPGVRRRYRLLLEALRGVAAVQTLSETTARLVGDLLGPHLPAHVVGAAPDAAFHRPAAVGSAQSVVRGALAADGLIGSYVLCPSGSHPRKNNELLIRSWAAVREGLRSGRQLVITGELGEPTRHHYATLAAGLGAPGAVVTPGHVSDDLLVALHQGADLVCYPTLAEGSNLPIAEAFACGAAVIASNRPPLDELVGPEGRFDPTDPATVTGAIERALDDEAHRDRLRRPTTPLGDWSAVAAASADAFDELLRSALPRSSRPLRRRRPRMAFVSPLPPAPSGVAGYSYSLLEAILATEKVDVDVFRDGPTPAQRAPGGLPARSSAALGDVEALSGRYDHVVYAVGNSHHHLGALAALRRRRGIVVAHDVRLSNLYRHESGARGVAPGGLGRAVAAMYGGALPRELGDNGEFSPADLERFGVLMAREVIASSERFLVSSEVAASLGRLDAGAEFASRVAVLPFAVAPARELAEFAEEQRPLPDGVDPLVGRWWGKAPDEGGPTSVVAHFGIVDPIKLPALLLEAYAAVRRQRADTEMVFVGPVGDDLVRSLSALAVSLGIADGVGFTGPLPAARYARWFDRATVAVQLRATTNGEASAAVGECLAAGLATVVTRLGWSASLPDEAVAKLDQPSSPAALSHLLAELLADPGRRSGLQAGAARYAGSHTFDHTARSLLGLLFEPQRPT